ncbi:9901_t:CDS:2 [Acaulospora morrowiae]|uniref:9901_t:CDS:1 n=1 Tax=Acaulospora morrowiae TaxID=94023 RepID=A0A9N8VUU7_9GLOM|nr:9901_t:CDS:2 [Acaulospora morrowiae]
MKFHSQKYSGAKARASDEKATKYMETDTAIRYATYSRQNFVSNSRITKLRVLVEKFWIEWVKHYMQPDNFGSLRGPDASAQHPVTWEL